MISPRNLKVRIAYVVVALAALAVFNFAHLPAKKAALQNDFENWLGEMEPKLEHPEITGTPFTLLDILLDVPESGLHLKLALTSASDQAASSHVARILEMAREAGLFSQITRNPGEIIFDVRSDKKNFKAALNFADIEQNSQAQAMIKLLEVYASSQPGEDNEKSK